MSEWTTIWNVLWNQANRNPQPFEISQVAPEAARSLGVSPEVAEKEISFLLVELARLPEGRRYFRREGNAVVPLPELVEAQQRGRIAQDVYPFEV